MTVGVIIEAVAMTEGGFDTAETMDAEIFWLHVITDDLRSIDIGEKCPDALLFRDMSGFAQLHAAVKFGQPLARACAMPLRTMSLAGIETVISAPLFPPAAFPSAMAEGLLSPYVDGWMDDVFAAVEAQMGEAAINRIVYIAKMRRAMRGIRPQPDDDAMVRMTLSKYCKTLWPSSRPARLHPSFDLFRRVRPGIWRLANDAEKRS